MSTSHISIKIIIRGQVQGVGYRYHTYQAARKIGVCGFVRNLSDGTVEALIEGSEQQIEEMKVVLANGPLNAIVTEMVEERLSEPVGHQVFSITG